VIVGESEPRAKTISDITTRRKEEVIIIVIDCHSQLVSTG